MVNDEIRRITRIILDTVDCEKLFLFGSYAYGTPTADSDYDFYVVLADGGKNPLLVMEDISWSIAQHDHQNSVDVLAQYSSKFAEQSRSLTIERKVSREGVVLYERPEQRRNVA
jgi:predicted nucleotidyltransferase